MDIFLITCLLYIPLSLGFAAIVAENNDKSFLFKVVIWAWIILLPITFIFNELIPFAGGGDDESYFSLANYQNNSIAVVFDITKFIGLMEQPGYPFLLSIINFISGHNLLVYKILNLCFLIILALTWYRIGVLLESREFGRKNMIIVLLLAPMWYYVFFLLKDMTIVLLQSLFLLGVVQYWRRNSVWVWLLIALTILIVLYFRFYLVLLDIIVVSFVLLLKLIGRQRVSNSFPQLLFGLFVCMGLLMLAGDQQFLSLTGITSDKRVISVDNINAYAQDESAQKGVIFIINYLLSETAGLSPQTWKSFDSSLIRGVLAIPWIFVIVPFSFVGLYWVIQPVQNEYTGMGLIVKLRDSRFLNTPWGVLSIFILFSFAISYQTGDSTRWRISDMPVFATIALAGMQSTDRNIRKKIIFIWFLGVGIFFPLFYLFK